MKDKNKTKEQLINDLKKLETKQKRTEGLLRENEERYNTLLETIAHGIQEIDTSGVITFTNKAYDEIFGYEKGEAIGKSILDKLAHDYKRKKLVDYLKTLVEDQPPPTPYFEKNVTKEREIVDVQVDWNYKRDKKGHVVGFISVVTDITKRNMAEKQIREAKDFLENIYKTSADGIMVTDQHGCITMVNEATAKMLGYSKYELIGKHTVELSPKGKNHEEQTKEFLSELFEKGIIAGFEHSWLKKDGSLIDFETSIALSKDTEGNVTGAVGGIRDITDHRRGEKELKETKNFLANVIENSWDPILVADSKGIITTVNKSCLRMLGYKREEVIGKHTSMLAPAKKGEYESDIGESIEINEEFFNNIREMITRLFNEGKVIDRETYFLRKDKKLVHAEESMVALYDEAGEIIGAVDIIRDISEKRKAEKEILDAKDFLENIFKTSVDGIVVTDRHSYITMVNETVAAILGCSKDELIGKHIDEFIPKGKKHRERVNKLIATVLEKGFVTGFERSWLRKDGSAIDVETNVASLKDKKGNIIGSVASIRDITERKHAERKIIEYQNQLRSLASQLTSSEEQNRQKFATFLHDQIGQTLFVLKIKLEMLQKTKSLKENKESLKDIFAMVNQLIEHTRSLTTELSPSILHQLGLRAGLEWLAEQTHEREGIIVQFEDDKQSKSLDNDISILLFRAVRELLINITKHAKAQKVKVSLRSDETSVRVCVEDDGIGFNASETISSLSKNNSFGLFSIKERLNYLGGHLEIKSTPGHGTRITLHAPLKGKNES